MAGLPYRLTGGALRPDALNFNPAFSQALTALYAAAPPAVQRELGLTSGFRDRATQERLFNASDKTGHSVARPGHSKHEAGSAADLAGFGIGSGSVSQATRDWVHANAKAHGLYFPMDYEPWHIQLAGDAAANAATGSGGGLGSAFASAIDPRAVAMAQLENDPFKAITDIGPRRSGLVGEGSAGGGLAAAPDADPGIPPLEVASANVAPAPKVAPPQRSPVEQLGQLAQLFKIKPIGQQGPAREGQALPMRRSI